MMTQPPHILIVDDHREIRDALVKYLERNGMRATSAADAVAMDAAMKVGQFDLIVLDVMMPGESGIELTRALRETHKTPILLLTAKGETPDRIEGLEAGADDYLPKPFEPKELLLRINAILRRMPEPEQESVLPKIVQMGPVRYDIERAELSRGGLAVRLTATEVQLMRIFAEHLRQPVSRSKLVEDLGRDGGQAQERAVDVQITRLRRKIEADPKQPRYLQTVRGEGYMLVPD